MKIEDLEKNESGVKEIVSILKNRRITKSQFAEMLGLPIQQLTIYLAHPERMPDVIWLGITTFLSGWQSEFISVNRHAHEMLAHVDYKTASCKECGKKVVLAVCVDIQGLEQYRLPKKGSVWLDEFKYCEDCGPRILEQAMKKQDEYYTQKQTKM